MGRELGSEGERASPPGVWPRGAVLQSGLATYEGHPAPAQLQPPPEQFAKEQAEPGAQARTQSPPEHSTLHRAPAGHEVLHWPPEQWTMQSPSPQYVTQRPPEQSRVHAPEGGHVRAQLPPEQSVVHGGAPQVAAQSPPVQLHVPPWQGALVRLVPVPGSETAGPPFGDVPGKVVLEPPHAASQVAASTEERAPRVLAVELSFFNTLPEQHTRPPRATNRATPRPARRCGGPVGRRDGPLAFACGDGVPFPRASDDARRQVGRPRGQGARRKA